MLQYFNGRKLTIRYKGMQYDPVNWGKGLTEGSLISPLLYILYTKIIEMIQNKTVTIFQYAVDLVICGSVISIQLVVNQLQSALSEFQGILGSLRTRGYFRIS